MDIEIRLATVLDLPEIKALFVNAVRSSCAKDYEPLEIDAWCESVNSIERWETAVKEQHFLLACSGDEILGFGSLKSAALVDKGYLDFMYVHSEFQSKGIAKSLLKEIEAEAEIRKIEIIDSDVSITALPFFEKNGFKKIRRNINRKGSGIDLVNYRMTKNL